MFIWTIFILHRLIFARLEKQIIGACGTVSANRIGMPNGLQPKQLPLQEGDEPVFMRRGNLVACAWQDTKRVTFLSTVDTNLTTDKRIRCKSAEGGYRLIAKPVIGERYNHNMAGVDRLNQMLGTYAYQHKSLKWYHTLFHRAREVALVNGFIIYKRKVTNKILSP